ncbi:MAG TPA: tetratricopeptide repeat protein, partial [Ramlibacter sp.]|nr:tetratricopeptide repeat protein [Ramlibacter sp.]
MGMLDWLGRRGRKPPPETNAAATPLQLYRAGVHQEAGQAASALLESNADHPEALQVKALLAHDRGQPALAVQAYERLVALQPAHVDAWVGLGRALAQMGQ